MTVFGRRVAPMRLLFTLAVLMSTATAQVDEESARCIHDEADGWGMFGQPGKDVCSVARELMGTCQLSHIPFLDTNMKAEDTWYTASRFKEDRSLRVGARCACDRVMYNLLSACAGCQKWGWPEVKNSNFTWQSFQTYQEGGGCSNSSTHTKRQVNWNSQPPTWATSFTQNTFDPIGAQSQISSSTPAAPTNVSPATADPAAETPSATGDVAQSTTTTSGPPIGAIVGGVIGGLIFLGAIAGLAYWIRCRKRRARDVAPSAEFLKPEYYATPPLLPAHERRDSAFQDEIEEDTGPSPTRRHSWATGLMTTRRHEEDDDDCEMLPPFTQGAYIGPSPHEKGFPERRDTGETDLTMRTNNTTTFLLSSPSPNRRPGASDYFA